MSAFRMIFVENMLLRANRGMMNSRRDLRSSGCEGKRKQLFFVTTGHVSIMPCSIHQHPSAYASIRQHTSAYDSVPATCPSCPAASVSIRQHPSASVSIRQHTSAYDSIRQHLLLQDYRPRVHHALNLRCQRLYLCTSKASKLREKNRLACDGQTGAHASMRPCATSV